MEEYLNVFLEEFADEVQAVNPARTFSAIFNNAYFSAELGEMSFEATQPRLLCAYEEVRDFTQNTTCTVRGDVYDVDRVEPDGTGMATVVLV
ncbi:MAG: head-tail joining protein [Desulfovibrio sp.]